MLANFKWPKPDEESDHKLIRDVIEHKCHLIVIPPDEHGPGYVFSIGLYLHFEHPEFVLFGLDYQTAGTAINEISALVQQGRRFQHKDVLDEIFQNVSVMLVEVDPKFYRDVLGTALWFYRSVGRDFPVLQIVWPDKRGRFPWDADFDQRAREKQPILAAVA
jgi:hypothetical protein